MTVNLTIQGNADKSTIDYSIRRLEDFSRTYNRARYEGMLR